jgi:hypothetical protein
MAARPALKTADDIVAGPGRLEILVHEIWFWNHIHGTRCLYSSSLLEPPSTPDTDRTLESTGFLLSLLESLRIKQYTRK